jgi:hypothetical protein
LGPIPNPQSPTPNLIPGHHYIKKFEIIFLIYSDIYF